jgi:FecR protein
MMCAAKIRMSVRCHYALSLASRISAAVLLIAGNVGAASDTSQKEARVTRVIRDVKLLPSKSAPKPAVVDAKVNEGTGVRTGDDSRSELTFLDQTVTRLGANTLFSFDKAGRSVDLSSGSMLLRVPEDSGGAHMTASAVTVGITGTTVILESARSGRNKLTVLEGGARVSLRKYPSESVNVRGGQMEDVPPGATKLPPPVDINVDQVMKTNPLITDFAPLPSRNLIYASSEAPSRPGPVFLPVPLLSGIVGGSNIVSTPGGSGRHGERNRGRYTEGTGKGERTGKGTTNKQGAYPEGRNPTPTPSPSKHQRRKPSKGY